MESIFEMYNWLFPGHLFSVGGGLAVGVFSESEVGLSECGLESLCGVSIIVRGIMRVGRSGVGLLVHCVVA